MGALILKSLLLPRADILVGEALIADLSIDPSTGRRYVHKEFGRQCM